MAQPKPQPDHASRAQQVRLVVQDAIQRRAGGEALPDQAVIAQHRHLMPELGDELARARLIEEAQARANALPALSSAEAITQAPAPAPGNPAPTPGNPGIPGGNGSATDHPEGPGIPPDRGVSTIERPPLPGGPPLPEVRGYRITGRLGAGGMGVVWRAVQLSTKRVVALKLMSDASMASPRRRERFVREIQLCAALEHPHIVRIYEPGARDGVYFYAMELIDGDHLDDYVAKHELATPEIVRLMMAVCRAIQFAHQRGIIHRDLKPSNILVTSDGAPHVVDFGLAKGPEKQDPEETALSHEGEVAGTLPFMAPEQAAGRTREIDTRTDVYSLGVILYRLVTGRSPHDLTGSFGEVSRRIAEDEVVRPRSVNHSVDSELEAILLKALAKEPDKRYATAAEFAQDLNNYLSGEPLTAKAPTTFYFLTRRMRKYKGRVTVAAILAIVLVGSWVYHYFRIAADKRQIAYNAMLMAAKSGVQAMDDGDPGAALLWHAQALNYAHDASQDEWEYRVRFATTMKSMSPLEQMWFVKGPVTLASLIHDGKNLMAVDGDDILRVWDSSTANPTFQPIKFDAPLMAAEWNAAADAIVTVTATGSVRLWNGSTGVPLALHIDYAKPPKLAVLAANGTRLFCITSDNIIEDWNVDSARNISPKATTEALEQKWDLADAISPDGQRCAAIVYDSRSTPHAGWLDVWDVGTGVRIGPRTAVALASNPALAWQDHDILLVANDNGVDGTHITLQRYDTTSGRALPGSIQFIGQSPATDNLGTGFFYDAPTGIMWLDAKSLQPHTMAPVGGDIQLILPNATIFAVAASGGWVRLFDIRSNGRPLVSTFQESPVSALSFSSDGRHYVTATTEGVIRLSGTWPVLNTASASLNGAPLCVAQSPDATMSLIGTTEGAGVWDSSSGLPISAPIAHPIPATSPTGAPMKHGQAVPIVAVDFSPDSALVATAGETDHTVRLWEARTGQSHALLVLGKHEYVRHIYFSADSHSLLIVTDSAVRLMDATTGHELLPPLNQPRAIDAAINARGDRIVTVGNSPTGSDVTIWDNRGAVVARLPRTPRRIEAIRFAVDGQSFATLTPDARADCWDSRTGAARAGHPADPFALATQGGTWAGNGQTTIAAQGGSAFILHADDSGAPIQLHHRGVVITTVTMSDDGNVAATAGSDNTVLAWSTRTGLPICPVLHLGGAVPVLAAPLSQSLLTASTDRSLRFWDLRPQAEPRATILATAELLSARKPDAAGASLPLSPEVLRDLWNQFHKPL